MSMNSQLSRVTDFINLKGTNYELREYEWHNAIDAYAMSSSRCIRIAVLYSGTSVAGIGYSVCSVLDQFDEKRAAQIARGMAVKSVTTYRFSKKLEPYMNLVDQVFIDLSVSNDLRSLKQLAKAILRGIDKRRRHLKTSKLITMRFKWVPEDV